MKFQFAIMMLMLSLVTGLAQTSFAARTQGNSPTYRLPLNQETQPGFDPSDTNLRLKKDPATNTDYSCSKRDPTGLRANSNGQKPAVAISSNSNHRTTTDTKNP